MLAPASSSTVARRAYEEAAAAGRTGQFAIEQRGGNAVLLPGAGDRR